MIANYATHTLSLLKKANKMYYLFQMKYKPLNCKKCMCVKMYFTVQAETKSKSKLLST
jgi:hypothetical protein